MGRASAVVDPAPTLTSNEPSRNRHPAFGCGLYLQPAN